MERTVAAGAQGCAPGSLRQLGSARPERGGQGGVFDLFVGAAPWEFAEINALFSWRNEWLCLTSFVKRLGIHSFCLVTAEKEHMVLNGSSWGNKTQQS